MEFDLKHTLEHHLLDHVYSTIPLGSFQLHLSKHLLMMAIASAMLLIGLPLIVRQTKGFGLLLRHAVESVVLFIRNDLVVPNLGKEGIPYLPFFCTAFFFILACNLLGLVPFGAAATGNFWGVTVPLALITFSLIHIAGIREHGLLHYLKGIVPHGVPLWLYPLVFPIEILGVCIKAFALAIRLALNMMAGHIVILALMGLIFIFGALSPIIGLGVTAPFSIVLVLFVMMLELFVAFLQAYIFTFLSAIFVGGAVHQH